MYEAYRKADNTITLGRLREMLSEYGDDCEVAFGSGNLTFYRVKRRGDKIVQIDFNEDTAQLPASAYPENGTPFP